MKIYWWDEQGYGTWAFVLAESEWQARELLEASAKIKDGGSKYNFHERAVETFIKLKSLEIIEPGIVRWGEFA